VLNVFDDRRSDARAKIALTSAFLVAVNAAAWLWAWAAFFHRPSLLGMAVLAYVFGLRHAFDPDHIAAIDNVTRKLMQEGKAPFSVGFFFSLGHSTIVVLASIAVATAAAGMQGRLEGLQEIGGVVGAGVSSLFLMAIGLANVFILKGVWTAFKQARRGEAIADQDLHSLLAGGGLIARLFRPLFRVVSRSWHMYPVGFLFGLGFDTATEIGLLGISASQAAQGLSFWNVLVFPALFTAGMSLMDTADSALMSAAYGWSLLHPVRKLWYNLTITAASVLVALFIGGVELIGLTGGRLGLDGAAWTFLASLNDNLANFGYVVVGIFLGSWILSMAIYRARYGPAPVAVRQSA